DCALAASSAAAAPGTKCASTLWAAATAAASGDAAGGASTVPRYGSYSPVMALTASNTASCVVAATRENTKGLAGGSAPIMWPVHCSTTSSARADETGPDSRASRTTPATRTWVVMMEPPN